MSKENIDYRAIVERITEILHGSVTDIGLLTVTVQSYKDRLVKVEAEREALAAENAALKTSRAVLAENTFEACNAIASAGFSHEAIMRGLYESTGNGNKYPKPITTLVDEAMRKLETPATDAFLHEVKSQARQEGAYFVANRMLAAWDAGFIEDTAKNVADIARMILTSTEFMADAPDGDFDRAFADSVLADIAAQLRVGGAA